MLKPVARGIIEDSLGSLQAMTGKGQIQSSAELPPRAEMRREQPLAFAIVAGLTQGSKTPLSAPETM
jgi:hypothetical protein